MIRSRRRPQPQATGKALSLTGIGKLRHQVDVKNAQVKRAGLTGAVSVYACGCSDDCGFTHLTESVPAPPRAPAPSGKRSLRRKRR